MDINQKDLDRGYLDTGYIPETGESVFKDTEAEEMKMRKKYGMPPEEYEGFLERNNYDDRM